MFTFQKMPVDLYLHLQIHFSNAFVFAKKKAFIFVPSRRCQFCQSITASLNLLIIADDHDNYYFDADSVDFNADAVNFDADAVENIADNKISPVLHK